MRIIRDAAVLDSIPNSLCQRINELAALACFVLIEPGDTIPAIEAELHLSIAPDPMWEWLQDHGGIWEAPFILTDDGYGHVLLIPNREGIDPALLKLCRNHADQGEGAMTG